MTDLNDPRKIVPQAIQEGAYAVRPFDFAVRTIVDYDATFLQDRVHSSIFINGQPAGVYAAARVDDRFDGPFNPAEAIARYGPDLERMVIDEFMGLGYRKRVRELEAQVARLQAHIDRPRWWQFRPVRREWRRLRARIADRINPKETE